MRILFIVLCASCLFCSKGKSEEKKDVSSDSLEISETLEKGKEVAKTVDSVIDIKKKDIKVTP